jgi:hypothetical protein
MPHGVCFTGRTVRVVRLILAILFAVCGSARIAGAQTTVTLSTPGTQVNVDTTIQGGASALLDSVTATRWRRRKAPRATRGASC